jgi:FtsZ-binding cell division protein ZapB
MTKRFKLGYVCGDYGLIDNDEWIDLHSMSENSEKNVQICINKMNELADENEQLKHKLQQQEMEYATDLHRLAEENEQLRTKNNAYIQDIEVFKEENTHLKLENEQLKSDLQYWAKTAEARLNKIEQLKHRLAISEKANLVTTLEKENEKLKLELGTYKEANKLLKQTIDRLLTDNIHYKTKLNEQMKKEYKKNE